MTLPLVDAANVLRAVGLDVLELPGWKTQGETDGGFNPHGIILHHDAMGLGNLNVPNYMHQNGVNGAQFWVGKDGRWVCIAAGRKWQAGTGGPWRGIPQDSGNKFTCGVETDHTVGQIWTTAQVAAIDLGCQALVHHYEWDVARYCCGHKEYAPTRKIDPENFDLNAWRSIISKPIQPIIKPPEDDVTAADLQAIKNMIEHAVDEIRTQTSEGNSIANVMAHLKTLQDDVTDIKAKLAAS